MADDKKDTKDEPKDEPKSRRFTVEVTDLPTIRQSGDGRITSFTVPGKAAFKGEITLKGKGDVASAFWSVTPGMRLSVVASETGEKEYTLDEVEVIPNKE